MDKIKTVDIGTSRKRMKLYREYLQKEIDGSIWSDHTKELERIAGIDEWLASNEGEQQKCIIVGCNNNACIETMMGFVCSEACRKKLEGNAFKALMGDYESNN